MQKKIRVYFQLILAQNQNDTKVLVVTVVVDKELNGQNKFNHWCQKMQKATLWRYQWVVELVQHKRVATLRQPYPVSSTTLDRRQTSTDHVELLLNTETYELNLLQWDCKYLIITKGSGSMANDHPRSWQPQFNQRPCFRLSQPLHPRYNPQVIRRN